ncbi:DUF58 domain-containing protein [Luteolibacter pohnpeiensis]|uniref:DUF58 domain-containing protein n=1 Tax=Luteolibacter pohnpeiensis TaxID=454153 RepID=A0A934VUA4_9BACT|nr:DUF58 domain-containing protein [Luteolibacter pohnpeiensis]MBK1880925.1 DUF58 domain-containing protein [Luteolibacter pohnpeiensis]
MSKALVTITLNHLLGLKADAHGFSFTKNQPANSILSGRHASRLRGRGLTFEELRLYHPGDDVRSIDWRATARLRSPHVRVYTEERERPVLVIVDQRATMFFGSRRAMKSVAAAELAALVAWRAIQAGERIGGLIFNDSEITTIRPNHGHSQAMRLFQQIVRYNQDLTDRREPETTISLNSVLQSVLQIAHHDYLIILISDLEGADDLTHQLTINLNAHNDLIIAAVYDPLGAQIKGSSGMRATQNGHLWQIPQERSFQQNFQRSFQQLAEKWTRIFRGLRIPIFPISTSEPVIDQLRESLRSHV